MNARSSDARPDDSDLLTTLLAEEGVELPEAAAVPVRRNRESHRLSFAQQRLWTVHELYSGARSAYNIVLPVRLSGVLHTDALEASLNRIIERHEVLRSCFISHVGQPQVRVLPAVTLRVNSIDLRARTESDRRIALAEVIAGENQHVFDLERAPLMRVTLLRTHDTTSAAVLTLHHLVADAWSMEILIRELGRFYGQHLRGGRVGLAELPIQYGDYAEWQHAEWEAGRVAGQLDYWVKHLAGATALELPAGRSAAQRTTFAGAVQPFRVPLEVTTALKRLGQQAAATVFMTVLAAFNALLYRYTGQSDLLVGTPVANRQRRELEPLIGFFVNTVVLRSRVAGDTTFRSLVEQVRETALAAYSRQDVPFDQIVHELALDRGDGLNPLFQVMFSLESGGVRDVDLPGVMVSPLPVETTTSKFDLTLALTDTASGLAGGFEYSSELFDAATMARMAEHFGVLLAAAAATPDRPIAALPILSRPEEDLVVRQWNRTARDYPADASIVDVFEAQAARSPDSVALEFGDETVTYGELNRRADRCAGQLRAAGIQDEECVGICVNPGVGMVVGLIGILKAGGVYVPLNPADPPARIRVIVAEARLRVVLTEDALEAVLPGDLVQAVHVGRESSDDGAARGGSPRRSDGGSLAYIIYTSGSSGDPKGIAVPHRAVLRLVLNTNYIGVEPSDRIAQASTFTFDAITFELWGALLNGACLVGVDRDTALSPARLARLLVDARITTLFLTTALFNAIVQADPNAFATLRHLLFGGEAVDPARVAEVFGARAPARLLHVYGPTETTTFATWFLVEHVAGDARTIPIGRPISNTEAYVLDGSLRPVPIGVPGELYLAGDGLARGYWAQPGLTADKFRPHPFDDSPGRRVYKTGDWVRTLPTGDIEFLGRIDQQVKIRGFRIELGDIEAALLRHPGVRQAVVRAHRQPGHHRLIAYVVPRAGAECGSADLLAHLRELLPNYMIPAQVVHLDQFPMTAGGKIDRKRLPALEAATAAAGAYEAPRSAAERLLAEVWQDVLGAAIVGVTDNYLELGGDSITAIQVASRVRRGGWDLEPGDIIRRPTIAALVPRLRRLTGEHRPRTIVTGPVPLTPIQRWFFETHAGDLHHFNQTVLLKSRERLHASALEAALRALQEHHDALRATYAMGAQVEQRFEGLEHPLVLEDIDLRGEGGQAARLDVHAAGLQGGLNLQHGPLMKAAVYRLDDGDRLLLIVHHLVVDLMSWRILLEDLETAYQQRLQGADIDLGPKTDSYQLWAEEIVRFSASPEHLQESDCWWNGPIAPPVPNDPTGPDDREPSNLFGSSAVVHTTLGEDETRDLLTGVHHAYHTEVNDLMLTALGRALRQWNGSPENWITLEGHGREPLSRPLNLARTVGWFTSLYPFLLDVRAGDPGRQLCEVKEALRRVVRKGVGYGILRYVTPPEQRRGSGLTVRPEISFNYAGQFDGQRGTGRFELTGESCGSPVSPHLVRQHGLDISSLVVGGRLEVSMVFDRRRYPPARVDQLLAAYVSELLAVAAHCRQRPEGEKTPSDFVASGFSLDEYRRFLETNHWHASEIEDIYPLSPMQEGLLFQQLFDRTSDAYFIQTVCRIEGTLDADAFRESWERLFRRHAVLRTAFVHDDLPRPLQVVFTQRSPDVEVVDLRGLGAAEQSAAVIRSEARDRQRRFDLQRDALMRVTLLRLSDTTSHLIWAYPHLIVDGWCVGIIYQEFLQIYQALSSGARPALAPAPQYRDYIAWLQRTDVEAARRYWASRLDGYERAVTPGRGALAPQSAPGEWRTTTIDLPAALCDRARQVAGELSVTLNTIAQTAWGLVLSRYNDTRDVVFGTIVSGRPAELPGVEETVGVFINAVPVRIRYERDQSIARVLQHVQRAAIESERFQHLPLAEILAHTACGRGLFDHLLVFENYPVGREPLRVTDGREPALAVQFVASQDRTHYDFDLVIVPGDPIQIQIGYTTASYDDRQIERTAAHLERAIAGIVRDPADLIDRVDILPGWEREAVVAAFNHTDRTLWDDRTVVEMFEDQVRRRPDALALSYRDRAMTYRELSAQVDRLSRRLADGGVGPEILVAINVERSLQMVIGMLAVLKAGGAYLPIDAAAPPERLAFILADARPEFLLTERGGSGLPTDARTIYFDADKAGTAAAAGVAPGAHPDSLAYVIYTSGTTGHPKGVLVQRQSLVNGACAWRQYYGLDALDVRMLQMAPFSSDVFSGDVIRCLTSGGALTICPSDIRADPASLYELMAAHRISIFESTPALVIPLMDYIHESRLDCSFLRVLIIGSDTLPGPQYRTLVERFGHRMRIVNSYGVTEATIESSCFEQSRGASGAGEAETFRWPGPTPIGRPLLNMRYLVWDRAGRPLPIGFPGELHIGGEGVARGYLGRTALTAERFIPDPGRPGARLYKSGDIVRWLPDGNLEFIGRNDQQVKIRGYRIELGEIEHWLLQHPGVSRAVVRLKDYGQGDRELVAYVVGTGSDPGIAHGDGRGKELQRFLAAKLPDYMVPRYILEMPAIPLTVHGKVDHAALPDPVGHTDPLARPADPDGHAGTFDSAPTAPEPYRTLVQIWEEVLRIRSTGFDDDFFQLGGHSLKAMQIMSRVHKHLGVRISYRDFFEHPTLAGLSALVVAAHPGWQTARGAVIAPDRPEGPPRRDDAPSDHRDQPPGGGRPPAAGADRVAEGSDVSSIGPRQRAADYALSHAQKRLWLLHQLDGQVAYNMPQAFVLEDDLDLEAVGRAIATLVERHEALRTAFVVVDDLPRQKILDAVPLAVRFVDVSGAADPEARARQLAAAEAAEPFDLATPPLLRGVVFRLGPRRHVFLLVMHHIIGDGWSMNVLYREVITLYTAYREGRPNPLSPLRIQYADYAEWQNRRDFAGDERYWLEALAGVPDRLRLPFDQAPAATREFAGHAEELWLGAAATAHLRAVAAAHRTTLSNVVLAMFQFVLGRWTSEPDLCVGLSIANRSHPDLESLIGFFVNVLPIRVLPSRDMEFGELLAQVVARTAEAFEHQDYPFDRLIEALNPDRVGTQQPLVNVIYAFQNFEDVAIDIGLRDPASAADAAAGSDAPAIAAFPIPFETSKFDLTLFVTEAGERLQLTLEYDTQLFRPTTIRRCLGWIERLAGLVA